MPTPTPDVQFLKIENILLRDENQEYLERQIPIRDEFFLNKVPIHHFKNMVNLILSKAVFA